LDIAGSSVLVGAFFKISGSGAAYVFTGSGGTWSLRAELTASGGAASDNFGYSVALSGTTAMAGAYGEDSNTGAAYVFVLPSQQAELTPSGGAANDNAGISVALSGSTAVVGAYGKNSNRGAVYVFTRVGSTWTQQATLTASQRAAGDFFGFSVALSGSTAVVGAPGRNSQTGAAYVFVDSGGTWSQQATLTASQRAAGDSFGVSVAVSGSTAVVGASGKNSQTGAAYVFVRSGTAWSQQATLAASDAAAGDTFGVSVAVSGSTAVVGASGKNSQSGTAYVFLRSGSTWSQQAKLTASDGAESDEFGFSVAIAGSTAVVGAAAKNSQTGAAYVFVRSGTAWSQQAELTASDAAAGDFFGNSVALSASTAVFGTPGKNSFTGAAYVFTNA
jgi:hypothetical protein